MLIIFMDAQCQSLFQKLSFKSIDIEGFYLNKFSDDSQKVCISHVALECLEELHSFHNGYPSAPKKIR